MDYKIDRPHKQIKNQLVISFQSKLKDDLWIQIHDRRINHLWELIRDPLRDLIRHPLTDNSFYQIARVNKYGL